MPFGALAAGIAATGALVGAAVKNRMDKRRYERQLSDQQKMWQQANTYNSPAAQRMRLQQAGLNPNLVYQNGGSTPTSDTVTPPSYADSPIMDFTSAARFIQESPTIEANIRKTTAEAERVESENKDRFTPLSRLYNFDQQEKDYWARAYGFENSAEVDNLSLNRLSILSELKNRTNDSKNLAEVNKILNNNVGSSENEAYTAAFVRMLTEMEAYTEAKKRGFEFYYDEGPYGKNYTVEHPSAMLRVFKDKKALDYVAEMFLREYKQIHWQSSDAKHILEEFHQTMRDIPFGRLKRSEPTLRGIERSGYDKKRGSLYTYDRYDYSK